MSTNQEQQQPKEQNEKAIIIAIETGEKTQETSVNRSAVKSAKEIMEMGITETPMLIEGLIPTHGVSSLAGSSDLGKSYLLMQMVDAIVNGDPDFLGFKLNARHKRAVYVSTEDDYENLCPRLLNLTKERKDRTVYEQLKIITTTESLIKKLDKLLTEHPADLIALDTFSDLYGGDMNQSNKVRFFLQHYKELASKHGTHLIINHHCGKKNDYRAPHKDNLLGSQGFESAMRTVMELRQDFNNPDLRHLCIVKANYLGEDSKNRSYALQFDYSGNGFTNTGVRVSFTQLAKPEGDNQYRGSRDERVLQLRNEKKTIDQIVAIMKAEGIEIGRSTVGNICKANPSIQVPLEKKMDGQDKPTAINKEEEISRIQSFLKVPITDLKFDGESVTIFSDDIDLGTISFFIVFGAIHYENLHLIKTHANWKKIYEKHTDIIKGEIRKLVNKEDDLYIHSTNFRECDICTDTKLLFTVVCEFNNDFWSFSKKSNTANMFDNSNEERPFD